MNETIFNDFKTIFLIQELHVFTATRFLQFYQNWSIYCEDEDIPETKPEDEFDFDEPEDESPACQIQTASGSTEVGL